MKNGIIYFIAGIVILILLMNNMKTQSILGTETMTRTITSTANPDSNIMITYSVSGVSDKWAATIEESVSGGCTLLQSKTYMISTQGITKNMVLTTPASGSCVLTGNYQFGNSAIKSFDTKTITITSNAYDADLNNDGKIDSSELLSAVSDWVNGNIDKSTLNSLESQWKVQP